MWIDGGRLTVGVVVIWERDTVLVDIPSSGSVSDSASNRLDVLTEVMLPDRCIFMGITSFRFSDDSARFCAFNVFLDFFH